MTCDFYSKHFSFCLVGRVAHPDAPEQKLAGIVRSFSFRRLSTPTYLLFTACIRFRHVLGRPGYVTVSAIIVQGLAPNANNF